VVSATSTSLSLAYCLCLRVGGSPSAAGWHARSGRLRPALQRHRAAWWL